MRSVDVIRFLVRLIDHLLNNLVYPNLGFRLELIDDTLEETHPCYPSPCGPNSQCQSNGNVPICTCLTNYFGAPPNCRAECSINSDCANNKACMNEKCRDPCIGVCGVATRCHVMNHTPICTCMDGLIGDPFTRCYEAPIPPSNLIENCSTEPIFKNVIVEEDPIQDACNPSPCGSNALCRNGECTCLQEYIGNPYQGCRPECVLNSECPRNRACINRKCVDPCIGVCAQNALCDVINHLPMCSCPHGMEGNALVQCRPVVQRMFLSLRNFICEFLFNYIFFILL